MLRFSFLVLCWILLLPNAKAQSCVQIIDGQTRESVPFVAVQLDNRITLVTDSNGIACFPLAGRREVRCEMVGYEPFNKQVDLQPSETTQIALTPAENLLNLMVVSGTKYIKPIEKLTVSMEVIRGADLTRKVTPNLSDAIERLPGINILDGQASIRGGSSYAYGAGSRVLLVVDDMPLMTSDRNDIKWNFVPLELVDQVEVTKGASSVSYGASALNGIIQVALCIRREKRAPRPLLFTWLTPSLQELPTNGGVRIRLIKAVYPHHTRLPRLRV